MTSLDDTYHDGDRLRLVAGSAVLFAGSVLFGIGLTNVVGDALGIQPGTTAKLAVAGVLAPGALLGLRQYAVGGEPTRPLQVGAGLAAVGVLGLLVGVPGPLAGVLYLAGVALLGGEFVTAATDHRPATGTLGVGAGSGTGSGTGSASGSRVSWVRDSPAGPLDGGPTTADGGDDEDDDLQFHRDEE